jgi:hypothetical protein
LTLAITDRVNDATAIGEKLITVDDCKSATERYFPQFVRLDIFNAWQMELISNSSFLQPKTMQDEKVFFSGTVGRLCHFSTGFLHRNSSGEISR